MQTDHLMPDRRPNQVIINNKKGTYRIVDFAVAVEYWLKIKESEKRDKYLDLAREQKKWEPWRWR